MVVGYAAFSTNLEIKGTSKVTSNWDIEITNVSDGTNNVSSSYTATVLEKIDMGGQKVEVVTSGDGLYEDGYEDGKYTYKGANPNNYIIFNNETWRIIAIDKDKKIKIISNEYIESRKFDSSQPYSNEWETSDIKTYLNETYLSTITTNKDKIVAQSWNVGTVTENNNDLTNQIAAENSKQSQSISLGLITASEYLRANTNVEQCGNMNLNNANRTTCRKTNWMYTITPYYVDIWTITPSSDNIEREFIIDRSYMTGSVGYGEIYVSNPSGVTPALYLTSNTQLSGSGTQSDPYRIIN